MTNLRKILTEFRNTTKRTALPEAETKIIDAIKNIREGLIYDLNLKIQENGYSKHIVRETITRKFDEL